MRFKRTPLTIMAATFVAIVFTAVTALFTQHPAALIGAAVLGLIVVLVTVKGDTLAGFMKRRHDMHKPMRATQIIEHDSAGIVWDEVREEMSMWVEITPGQPFGFLFLDEDGESELRVDTDLIADLLVQDNIRLDRADIISFGAKSSTNTRASSIITTTIGHTRPPVAGRCFLAIYASLGQCHAGAGSRAPRGDLREGLKRALTTAVTRICMRLRYRGVAAAILSPMRLEEVRALMADTTGGAEEHVTWSKLGGGVSEPAVESFELSRGGASPSHLYDTTARRVVERVSLISTPAGVAKDYCATLVSPETDERVRDLDRRDNLRTRGGYQRGAVEVVTPGVGAETPATRRRNVGDVEEVIFPGSLGVFVGVSPDEGRVFVDVSTRTDERLYIVGPELLWFQFLMRLSLVDLTVDIRVPNTLRDKFIRVVDAIGSPNITAGSNNMADLIITTPERASFYRGRNTIVVTDEIEQLTGKEHYIVGTDDGLVMRSGTQSLTVPWRMSRTERDILAVNA